MATKKKSIKLKFIIFFLTIVLAFLIYNHYKHGLNYWFRYIENIFEENKNEPVSKYDIRNIELMHKHYNKTFGIDISHYQGDINWSKMDTIYNLHPIKFVFIRATMGFDKEDNKFKRNWTEAKKNNITRGAYHFYRPDENSTLQANNFINVVKLEKGDLPPVLDIETMPKTQSMDKLIEGLKNWCLIIENHYKIKPIIYTSDKFYEDFLINHFDDHIKWIANYNFFVEDLKDNWNIWQFTEKGRIKGSKEHIDINIFNGDISILTIK